MYNPCTCLCSASYKMSKNIHYMYLDMLMFVKYKGRHNGYNIEVMNLADAYPVYILFHTCVHSGYMCVVL